MFKSFFDLVPAAAKLFCKGSEELVQIMSLTIG